MWEVIDGGPGVSPAPVARGKHAATSTRGHLYVLGGRGAGGALPLRDFWRYSFVSNKWEKLDSSGDVPPALQEHSMTAHGGALYVFGGEPALSNETPLWVCDIQTLVWRKVISASTRITSNRKCTKGIGGAPRGRRGHSAHALDDCLLIYGGYQDLKGSTNELWAFHYETESWAYVRTATPGPARHRHVGALWERALYLHGGAQDLRDTADLWRYDTMSRSWRQVRGGRGSPAPRSGHAGLRAGDHLYIYGGQSSGTTLCDLWRIHFVSEVWERLEPGLPSPPPLVDAALLCCVPPPGPARRPHRPPAAPPRTRAAPRPRRAPRAAYRPLPAAPDSQESLRGSPAPLPRSRSAHALRRRPRPPSPDTLELKDLAREPISVPDFADMILPTPVLSPIEATKLVYLDSDEEEEVRREMAALRAQNDTMMSELRARTVALTKSASVRFSGESVIIVTEEETSDYCSAERVSGGGGAGFSNPHYLGPDPAGLRGARGDPEPGVAGEGGALLLVGGRAPPHRARLQASLALWTYCIDY